MSEANVLNLLKQSKPLQLLEIAEKLNLSKYTVGGNLRGLKRKKKLDIRSYPRRKGGLAYFYSVKRANVDKQGDEAR